MVSVFIFNGCSQNHYASTNGNINSNQTTFIVIGQIDDFNDLVYDQKTNIVYFKGKDKTSNHAFTPYYAKNGKPYKYLCGKFMEIN